MSVLGRRVDLLSPSPSLCWNSLSVIFNGDPKGLGASSLAQGCPVSPVTASVPFCD